MEPVLDRGNVFLIGMMGSGKSTLGRQLARALGKRFIDADTEIEAQMGVPVATIFEVEGEDSFRAREELLLKELCTASDIVLATGGGAVLREPNRKALRENGLVLYLHASVPVLWERTKCSRHRPLLRTGDPLKTLEQLYRVRDPIYRETAHRVVDADHARVSRLVAVVGELSRGALKACAIDGELGDAPTEGPPRQSTKP
jgi:shikimate kinase